MDVRILAATNQDLETKVKTGGFREDLYYRLNVVPITLPALRERPEDLPVLLEHFLDTVASRLKRERKALVPDAYRALLAYEWQGNVRELEHAIEQAVVLASDAEIRLADLPPTVRPASVPVPSEPTDDGPGTLREAKQRLVERFERDFIADALARHHGNISKAAEEMGMYRQQLQQKLAEYAIAPEPYRRRTDP